MSKRKSNQKLGKILLAILVAIFFGIASYFNIDIEGYINNGSSKNKISYTTSFDLNSIPEFTNEPYVVLNDNQPEFDAEDFSKEAFEKYSELDYLGRCGSAFANIGKEIMPKAGEERESISSVHPTGWVQEKYNGEYLYNRCHLIGYQLTAENDNEKNLITGTRYMNVEGMLPFENMVAEYIEKTGNHVLYRVTPIFEGENLLASGIQIEAKSVEDNGEGICFNVYVYNAQPGISIDYSDGSSKLSE